MMTELHELVEIDPRRNADERETTFSMLGMSESVHVFSAKPTIIRSLLRHDHFELFRIGGIDGGEYEPDVSAEDVDAIYEIEGVLPIGCLTVKSKPRKDNRQSKIVNHQTISPDAFE